MNTTKKTTQHVYDYAIIGSGLAGLAIATKISQSTSNVVLIDGSDFIGGSHRTISSQGLTINNGLRFIPQTQLSEKAILFLEDLLNLKLIKETTNFLPVTYESGGLNDFLGFGDNPPTFYDELNYFISPEQIQLNLEVHQWPQLLKEKYKGEILLKSYVTKFVQEEPGRISHLIINGVKNIYAQNFIYCGNVKDLAILLPDEVMSARAKHKITKGSYWTAVCLDIFHNHLVTESESIHVLNGTTQDDIGPCVGKFIATTDADQNKVSVSQWMTFMDNETAEDSEAIAHALKKIKRQIKRAYPEALENIKSERIIVIPSVSGNGDLKLSSDQSLPNAKNLWIGSGRVNSQKNIVGALLQAKLVLYSMGFTQENLTFNDTDQMI